MSGRRAARFSNRAERDYGRLAGRWRDRVAAAVEDLMADPLMGKKLKGDWEGYRSYRLGSLRIIYACTAAVLEVVAIADRKDVYR